jgi:DNA-binding NtrC family response regulator
LQPVTNGGWENELSIAAVLEDAHEPSPTLKAVDGRTSTAYEPTPDARPNAPRTVLIVEDEPSLRETLRVIFQFHGYETVEAADGEAALQILNERSVDVLLLDLYLPKLNGVDLLHQVDSPPPIVIVHSAFEFFSPEKVREDVGSKVFRMIRKPIPPPELLSVVSEALAELDGSDS